MRRIDEGSEAVVVAFVRRSEAVEIRRWHFDQRRAGIAGRPWRRTTSWTRALTWASSVTSTTM
jgi:hypothetical protein